MATVERSRAGALWCVAWTGLCLACFIILWVLFLHKRMGGERQEARSERPRRLQGRKYEELRMRSNGHQNERI